MRIPDTYLFWNIASFIEYIENDYKQKIMSYLQCTVKTKNA